MYKARGGQINALERPVFFEGVRLDPENQWIKLAELTPWAAIEKRYAASFEGEDTGKVAKPARMAVGTLVIKERYGFSDEDTVQEIRMNPYLQYYIGLPGFTHEPPFDASTITRFRKRVTPEMLVQINDMVIGRTRAGDEEGEEPPEGRSPSGGGNGSGGIISEGRSPESVKANGNESEAVNAGTMILDATCAPQNIRYPTDISLLSEAREKLEAMIDRTHAAGATDGKKPRTYRKRARRDYLRFVRNRKPSWKLLRKSLRKQLGYVARDLSYLDRILERHPDPLGKRDMERLSTIHTLYG